MKHVIQYLSWLAIGCFTIQGIMAQPISAQIDKKAESLEKKVVAWRRAIHEHPELGNREFQTAAKIAAHLQSLGMEVKTGVGKTGVVGLLKGGKPGPVVALRLRSVRRASCVCY